MASKRRGGGFRPPELRGTLGTLLRTTTGVVRDALERGARSGRARLDDARASRRRHDALADLGEIVLDLIRRGEIDLAELPEARDLIRELDELDTSDADGPDADDLPRTASRRRFDDRPTRAELPRAELPRDRRPTAPDGRRGFDDDRRGDAGSRGFDDDRRSFDGDRRHGFDDDRHGDAGSRHGFDDDRRPAAADPRRSRADSRPPQTDSRSRRPTPGRFDDDGTVSSGVTADRLTRRTAPELPVHRDANSTRAPTRPIKGMWRPQIDDAPDPADPADLGPLADRLDRPTIPARADRTDRPTTPDRPAAERSDRPTLPERPDRPTIPRDPSRKGGISFDDDDLSDYMHPDDVPPKPTPSDPDDQGA